MIFKIRPKTAFLLQILHDYYIWRPKYTSKLDAFLISILEQYMPTILNFGTWNYFRLTPRTPLKANSAQNDHRDIFQGSVTEAFYPKYNPKNHFGNRHLYGTAALFVLKGLQRGKHCTLLTLMRVALPAKAVFWRGGYGSQIVQHTGDALKIIPDLEAVFESWFLLMPRKWAWTNILKLP